MSTFNELSNKNNKIEYYHFRKIFNLILRHDVDVYKQLQGGSYDKKYDFTINEQKISIYTKIDNYKKVWMNQHDIEKTFESENGKKISYHILNPENNATCAFLIINKEKKSLYIINLW